MRLVEEERTGIGLGFGLRARDLLGFRVWGSVRSMTVHFGSAAGSRSFAVGAQAVPCAPLHAGGRNVYNHHILCWSEALPSSAVGFVSSAV